MAALAVTNTQYAYRFLNVAVELNPFASKRSPNGHHVLPWVFRQYFRTYHRHAPCEVPRVNDQVNY